MNFKVLAESLRNELDTYLKEVGANLPAENHYYDAMAAKALYAKRKAEILPKLEQQRKDFLAKDFQPDENWYDSKLTKD